MKFHNLFPRLDSVAITASAFAMKVGGRALRNLLTYSTVGASLSLVPMAHAGIGDPYAADADTLHLWHLDEADPGPAVPASGVSGSFDLSGAATLGSAAYAGFGGSVRTQTGVFASAPAISTSSVVGAGGAFTMEALINTSSFLTGSPNNNQFILGMDTGVGGFGAAGRSFQFKLTNSDGLNPFLVFTNIVSSSATVAFAIPTTGAHAFVLNEWYHVAVTYNGSENTADNMKMYWTKLESTATQAQLLGSGNMTNDLNGALTANFGVGNNGYGGALLLGFVDEVRVSRVALSADAFLFNTSPTVTTATPSSVMSSSAVLGGDVISDGGVQPVTERGIVWGLTRMARD